MPTLPQPDIEARLSEFERRMYERSERQRLRSRVAAETLHSDNLRTAATTGKDVRPPSEELLGEYRIARIGCWDAESGQLVEKIRKAHKAVRRREARKRRQQRESKRNKLYASCSPRR